MSNEPSMHVVMGPKGDLHEGIRGAFVGHPPPGVVYDVAEAQHTFIFSDAVRASSPYRAAHLAELIELPGAAEVAHSAYWPVMGRPGWVADMDAFDYPVLGGRYSLNDAFMTCYRGRWSDEFATALQRRAANMLAAYAHPSCTAVLFHSHSGARKARLILERLRIPGSDEFLGKVHVVYPVGTALAEDRFRCKWEDLRQIRVVFCGRQFDVKNGAFAVLAFLALAHEFPSVSFVYFGEIPDGVLPHDGIAPNVQFAGLVTHDEVRRTLADAHVLFHPTKMESVGMALLEAAAAGLAVVVSQGESMESVEELFMNDGAHYVNRSGMSRDDEATAFVQSLRDLLRAPDRMRQMAERNHRTCTSGYLSISKRDDVLTTLYRRSQKQHGPVLTAAALPHATGMRHVAMNGSALSRLFPASF